MVNEILGGKYIIKALLGSGGSGKVYLAKRLTTSDLCAVKVITTDDSQTIKLAQRETETLKRLNHKSIVQFIEEGYDTEHQCAYLVLEYLDGKKIKDYFNQDLSLTTKIELFLQILDALAYAHSKEVIHRDIKPDNIMVVDTGDIPVAKVLDFGISAITTTILTRTVSSYHTPLFSPPEQINCQGVFVDSDTYSLGMTILYLLANHEDRISFQEDRDKTILYRSSAQTLGVDEPYSSPLIQILIDATDPDRTKRPRLDEIRRVLRQLIDNFTESTPITFVITSGLKDIISNSNSFENSPLQIKRYLESKLGNGVSTLHIKQISNQNDRITVEIGNEITYGVFRGFIKSDTPNRIFIFSEREGSPEKVEKLFENGIAVKAVPQIVFDNHVIRQGNDLSDLIDRLQLREREIFIEREGRANIGSLFARWQNVIDIENKIVNERKQSFIYTSRQIESENQRIIIVLKEPISIEEFDKITSPPLPVTISVKGNSREFQKAIGSINDGKKSSTGEKVEKLYISLGDFYNQDISLEIANCGKVETNFKAQESEIGRRRKALRSIQYGDSENTHLCSVIVNPSTANVFEPVVISKFFNEQLDGSQCEAVCKALATEDVFLIQGPPGTGKTSVITEIILQILQKHPTHKILISSQSNVAVDNVLSRLAKIDLGKQKIGLLRIGREEKIEDGAKQFEIERAIMDWQNSIRSSSLSAQQNYSTNNENLLAGVKRLSDVETLSELQETRQKVSRNLLEDITQFNKDIIITEELNPLSSAAFDALDKIDERMQLDTSILEKLKSYLQKFGVKYPSQQSFSGWLEEEHDRLKNLLGDKNENYTQFLKLKTLSTEWNNRLLRKQVDLIPLFLESVNVIGATCLGSANIKEVIFDWVIIDEAGRSTAPETFVPMTKGRRNILVGDHKQLPPIIDRELQSRALSEQDISKLVLETSLFEYLYEELPKPKKITLSHQYRMHPEIGDLVSTLFYDNLVSSEKVDIGKKQHHLSILNKSIYWISTSDASPEIYRERQMGKSYTNSYEANLIKNVLQKIQNDYEVSHTSKEVGIIAGYASQVSLLETIITPGNQSLWKNLTISIHTVDAFQGGECDIIVYDLVRSNEQKKLGFTADQRRLNVALSRAKQLLIIIGNDVMAYEGKTPMNQRNPFTDLIEYIDSKPDTCERLKSKSFL
jgi:superfamily I DNA and/or RNA helicase